MPQEHTSAQESPQQQEHDETTQRVAPDTNMDSLDAVLDDI